MLVRPTPDRLSHLTPREREVLALIAKGLSNKAISQKLGVSEKTTKTHVSNLLAKLEAKSRTQLALIAKEQGF